MMLSTLFLALAICAAVVGIAFSMGIVSFLQSRGVKINWLLIKIMIIKYLGQYRDITIRETGKAGSLFYGYVIAMNTALVAGIIGLAMR